MVEFSPGLFASTELIYSIIKGIPDSPRRSGSFGFTPEDCANFDRLTTVNFFCGILPREELGVVDRMGLDFFDYTLDYLFPNISVSLVTTT